MTSCSTRELGPRFFVSAGMSCIRVSWLPFLRFFIAHGRGLLSSRALDNIERLIPFPPAAVECRMAPDCRTEESPSDGPVATKDGAAHTAAVLPASKMSTFTRRRKLKRDVTPRRSSHTNALRNDRCPKFRTEPIRRARFRRGGLLVRAYLSSPCCDAPLILGWLGP